MIVSVFTSLIVVTGVLTAIGCFITPCVRGLAQRLIETALLKQTVMEAPPYSDKVMILQASEEVVFRIVP